MTDINRLVDRHALASDQVSKGEIRIVLAELQKALETGIVGDVVEFGCYRGTTSLFLARLLQAHNSNKKLWLYDSFEGLPDKAGSDDTRLGDEFKAGELRATKAEVLRNFAHASLPRPIVKKGWFNELTANDVPAKICFAYFDGDFYESIRDSFKLCERKFTEGAIIVVDDYSNDHLPGARRAVDQWCRQNQTRLRSPVVERDSLAIIHLK